MHVFHIKGFSGLMLLLLAALSAIVLTVLLPSTFMMVLWNAVVFEAFHGPEIDIYQGFLLWGLTAVLIKLIFKPEIKLQFQQMPAAKKPNLTKPAETAKTDETVETKLEDAKPADNQN